MHLNKKTVFLGFIVMAVVVCSLPITRDEVDWRWAESRDQAVDFMRYSTDWPHGRHVVEARIRYDQRTWADTKKAMIRDAYLHNAGPQTNAAVRQERQTRKERFFWKQVTTANTLDSYQDYLSRYPTGQFAAQAREQIASLSTGSVLPARSPHMRDQ